MELEELEPAEASKEEEIKGFKKRKLDILERLTVAVGGASLDTDPPPPPVKFPKRLPFGQEIYVM